MDKIISITSKKSEWDTYRDWVKLRQQEFRGKTIFGMPPIEKDPYELLRSL